jgi:hypothetical protein
MSTKTKFVLSIVIMLGTACGAQAEGQNSILRQARPAIQRQALSAADNNHGFVQVPDQSTRMTAVYFDPNPALFNAFTYCASVQLGPSASKRGLKGEFRFPAFSATPKVSVQIISSAAAAPMHVTALKMAEVAGMSGAIETQILVEAETIFDVPANGIFYANVVVTGVPVSPPQSAQRPSDFHIRAEGPQSRDLR